MHLERRKPFGSACRGTLVVFEVPNKSTVLTEAMYINSVTYVATESFWGDYGDAGLTTIHCQCIGRGVVDETIVFMVLLRLTMVLISPHVVDVNLIAADPATLIKSSFDLIVFRMYSAVR